MSRTFAYLRVSTVDQTTNNQLHEIEAAGFAAQPRRVVAEIISGSVAAKERKGFARLLDRLGRNAMDVASTVADLDRMGVRVYCLALGGVDLTSSTGKLTMGVINAVAEFERDLLIERTQAGLRRAQAEGKAIGRPASLPADERAEVERRLEIGETVSALSKAFSTSRQTIMRVRDDRRAHSELT